MVKVRQESKREKPHVAQFYRDFIERILATTPSQKLISSRVTTIVTEQYPNVQ